MKNKVMTGHIAAIFTVFIWGLTFVSTKVLLEVFTPIEILFIRFAIGYITLWCVYPHKLSLTDKGQEKYFAMAGLCGIALYYLLENIALTMTLVTNVGVIISVAPFFTAILACIFLHEKRPEPRFFIGFIIAMAGICMISYAGGTEMEINPTGDILSILAAVVWAAYSNITKKISEFGYNTILTTRRTFFYGLLFMIPAAFLMGFQVRLSELIDGKMALNLLFLGLGASAVCFVTWNLAVRILGAVKTSVYIYMAPVITTTASALILHEKMTVLTVLGIALTLAGLLLSENRKRKKG